MKSILILITLAFIPTAYCIGGILLEYYKIIEQPAYWALYGAIFGIIVSSTINKLE